MSVNCKRRCISGLFVAQCDHVTSLLLYIFHWLLLSPLIHSGTTVPECDRHIHVEWMPDSVSVAGLHMYETVVDITREWWHRLKAGSSAGFTGLFIVIAYQQTVLVHPPAGLPSSMPSVWLILPPSFHQPISAAVPQLLWQSPLAGLALLNRWRQIAPMWWCLLTPIWRGYRASSALCLGWWYCLQDDNCVGCITETPLPVVRCSQPNLYGSIL